MRSAAPRYPVDRYLVESSKKFEMVNITDDDLWNPEPAIRPEDEILLRKLHEMLQSTADDLKLISGELMKCRAPRAPVRASPAPLDEKFNEKVHIEEIVDAKFHGYKIPEKPVSNKPQKVVEKKNVGPKIKTTNAAVQNGPSQTTKKINRKKHLSVSPIKLVQIGEKPVNNFKDEQNVNVRSNRGSSISYNEMSHTYIEPKPTQRHRKPLHIQQMPSINIRSELREQKVLQIDIIPEQKECADNVEKATNVAVIAVQHEATSGVRPNYAASYPRVVAEAAASAKPAVRRVSKMLTCESSDSSRNVSSDAQERTTSCNQARPAVRASSKPCARLDGKVNKSFKGKTDVERPQHRHVDEWKKKLNAVYGRPTTSRYRNPFNKRTSEKSPAKRPVPLPKDVGSKNLLNNAEYIPYTKLTLGGIRVSDIEKEISVLPDKNIPLSPILDKILSRENSFHKSPRKKEQEKGNIFTTSDENLLEEVLDIERNITSTLSKNLKEVEDKSPSRTSNISSDSAKDRGDKASYADDFEEERTDNDKSQSDGNKSKGNRDSGRNGGQESNVDGNLHENIQNATYTKSSNLALKTSVDVFEFVHSIDTQDHGTQSAGARSLSPKGTQTSPRGARPIRNDLWPDRAASEDFVKKLIVDECAQMLQKNLVEHAAAGGNDGDKNNIAASQKHTQTSPARVRAAMTSPARTQARATSPVARPAAVDRQTSPVTCPDGAGLRVDLSSPRFSLRLPRAHLHTPSYRVTVPQIARKVSSSSSAEGGYSSSDISSVGEIGDKYKRRSRKTKALTVSDASSVSSTASEYSSDSSGNILPLKSEGELSLGQCRVQHTPWGFD